MEAKSLKKWIKNCALVKKLAMAAAGTVGRQSQKIELRDSIDTNENTHQCASFFIS